MPPRIVNSRDHHTHRLLSEIEAGSHLSQRSLARSLGIALGLTNLLLRRLVRKGCVRMIQIRPNRVRYLLTPTGIAEKARMSRDSLQYSVKFYTEARQRIAARFAVLSEDLMSNGRDHKRIAFYGTGEIAEIGYVCLQETDLKLVAVIDDDHGRNRFFDVPIYSRDALGDLSLIEQPFGRLIVMSFENADTLNQELDDIGFPRDQVFWV